MRLSMSLVVVLLVSVASVSLAAIGPGTVLKGVNPALWERICGRADTVAREVLKVSPAGATPQRVRCLSAYLRIVLFRHAQVMEAFGPADPVNRLVTDEADPEFGTPEEKDNSSLGRMKADHAEACRDDDGPGGGTRVALRAWEAASKRDWQESPAYGPPILPPEHGLHKGARERLESERFRAQAARAYPGADVVGVTQRFLEGLASGQDVEQLRRFAGLAGQVLEYTSKGFRFAAAGELPVWFTPSEDVLPAGMRHTDTRQGL